MDMDDVDKNIDLDEKISFDIIERMRVVFREYEKLFYENRKIENEVVSDK